MRQYGLLKKAVAALLCLMTVFVMASFAAAEDLETPTLKGAIASGSGIKVTWNAVKGAEGYRVYRKNEGTDWMAIANVTGTSYTDKKAAANTTYTYTVRCIRDGVLASGFNGRGVSGSWTNAASLNAPKLNGAAANATGIRVTWEAVGGAEAYRVYRKSGSGGWAAVADSVAGTSYQDKNVKAGTSYTYTVRCLKGGKLVSGFDKTGVSATWSKGSGTLANPGLVSAAGENGGVRVKWNKVSGANGYRVYRKTASTNWDFLANVGDVSEYLDKTANPGINYTYTVRCMTDGTVVSGFDAAGVTGKVSKASKPSDAPILKSAKAEGNAIRVTWEAVPGVAGYRIYRKNGNDGWIAIADKVTGTSYLDKATYANVAYTYTVRNQNAKGELISGFDEKGVTASWSSGGGGTGTTVPVLKGVAYSQNTLVVSWNAFSGAAGYRVYRKTDKTNWVALANVKTTSYTDKKVTSGTRYTYTVRALNAKGELSTGFDAKGISGTFYGVPKMNTITSVAGGIQVTWKAVSKAPSYVIFRKPAGGTYTRIGTTTSTSLTDGTVEPNKVYVYTVAVVSADGQTILSDHPEGIQGNYVESVDISGLTVKTNGVEVKWNAAAGASKYRLFRKFGSGSWTTVTTTTATSYLDKNTVNNTTYSYYVRAMDANGKFVGVYNSKGQSVTFYATPTLIDCVREGSALLTTWEAVEGVSNYAVFRKIGSGTWMQMGTTAGTSYMDTSMPSGTWCLYTVRCANASGKTFLSAYDATGVGETSYLEQPVLNTAYSDNGGISFSWNSVDKASNYKVYRKTGARESWVFQKEVSGTYYLDKNVKNGGTYYYTVATSDGSGNDTSEYNATGVSSVYYQVPALKAVKNDATGVTVTWGAVDGIGSYRVFRKTGSGDWTSIGIASKATYTDTDVVSNANYWYTVCCVLNSADVSAFNQTGLSTTFYEAPTMSAATNRAKDVKVTWKTVDGIGAYRVFRKTSSTKWTEIGDVTGTTFYDTKAASGTTYQYTVRCLKGSSLVSYFNSTVSVTYLKAPVITVTSPEAHKAKVTWAAVTGATEYVIYRRVGTGSYAQYQTVTKTTFEDTGLASNTNFSYYVVAKNNNGTSASSDRKSVMVK